MKNEQEIGINWPNRVKFDKKCLFKLETREILKKRSYILNKMANNARSSKKICKFVEHSYKRCVRWQEE